jgi:hypothetical protein
LTGVSAIGQAGTVLGQRLIQITGNQAMGAVGDFAVFYWSLIDDSEAANWQNVDNSQSSGWAEVDDAQSSEWAPIDTN